MMHHKPSRHSLLASLRWALTEMRHPARLSALGLGALAPLAALANPTGGQVVGGSATISTPSANGTVINQSSQRAAINWQQFSVGANQYVQFVQPNSSAVVLNRVIGSNPSSIFGNITANGQVFLVNPNGILFAPGATLDVAGLVASTQGISNADFMAGQYNFSKAADALNANVINEGSITARPGGYVVLAGDYVQNGGHISAQGGRVYLAAGGSARLTMDNNGLISYSVNSATLARLAGAANVGDIVADGGAVVMTADVANVLTASAVNNQGFIAAHSIKNQSGEIILAATGGELVNGGTLDASATGNGVAGGTILVRGDGETRIEPTSVIEATGNGAPGGFVDLSGHDLSIRGSVNIGKGGTLLLDPAKLFITDGSTGGASITSGDYVGAKFIQNELNANASVVLVASNSIVAGVPIGGPLVGPATAITANSGAGNLTIKTGTLQLHSGATPTGSLMGFSINHCGLGVCTPKSGSPTLVYAFTPTNGTISLSGVTINIQGAFTANAGNGPVTLGNVSASGVTVTGGSISVGNVSASGATGIALTANSAAAPANITTGTLTAGAGPISVVTNATSYGGGISISAASGKTILLQATATRGGGDIRVNKTLKATGSFASGSNKGMGIVINANATGGATASGGNVALRGSGSNAVVATAGGVRIHAHGGLDSGGKISASGDIRAAGLVDILGSNVGSCCAVVSLQNVTGAAAHLQLNGAGSGTSLHVGAVHATGTTSIASQSKYDDVQIMLNSTAATSSKIVVGGPITTAKGSVKVNAWLGALSIGSGGIAAAGNVALQGATVQIGGNLTAAGTLGITDYAGLSRGNVTVATGKVLKGKIVSIGMFDSYGGNISIGAVSAGSRASISLSDNAGSSADKITAGAITAPHINVSAYGKHETIVTGALTATAAAAPVSIQVNATSAPGGFASVDINGNITASGKTAHTGNLMSPYDLPEAALVSIGANGSGSGAHVVKVNGAVSVNATAGAYGASSRNEVGPVAARKQSGTGGVASVFINAAGSHGAASVTGAITAKGPDAHVEVQAHSVAVGNVTVTGSGHSVSRTIVPRSAGVSYTSHNSAGQATVELGGYTTGSGSTAVPGVSATVKAGNIAVSGKGVAEAALLGSRVSAGNIGVTAAAAAGTVKQKGSVSGTCLSSCNRNSTAFFRGPDGVPLDSGSIHAGRADIFIGAQHGAGNGSGSPAVSIKVGGLSVSGVGLADIDLEGATIQTQALSATATKGTIKGTGASTSGVTAVNTYTHTFNINGGAARIKIRSGNSGSHSSGVLTLNGGPVTIGGNVTVTGPTADVDVKAKSIKIGGTVTVTGSGGSSTEKTVFTPAAGTGYTTSFNGVEPTALNLQGAISGSVSVAGKTTIKGPGIVGAIAVGGTVKLNGFSGSASAVKNYSVLDTRVSPTAVNFTAGSLAVIVSDVATSGGKPVFTSAVDTGDMKFSAKGNVDLATRVNVKGTVLVEAVGSIFGTSHNVVAHFNSIDGAHPHANSGGGNGGPSPGVLPASALQADAMAMVAGKGITLTGTQLNIGTGSISSVHGDSTLIAVLAAEGLAPASANPNGAFIAGGAVTLGNLQLTGSYLLLQGSAVSVLGKVTAPKGTLVQVEPFDLTLPIDIEDSTLLKSVLGSVALTNASGATSFGLTNASFLSLFPGDTVAVGGTGEAGVVTIGANGPLDIGDTNLIIYTTGNVTGLGTVTSTGIVQSLISVLGPAVPPVTAGEVDPTAGSDTNTGLGDQTDKRKIGEGGDEGGGDQQPAGTVSQDSGNASVCH